MHHLTNNELNRVANNQLAIHIFIVLKILRFMRLDFKRGNNDWQQERECVTFNYGEDM